MSKRMWPLVMLVLACTAHAVDIVTPTYESRPKFYVDDGQIKGLCIDVLKAVERLVPDIHFVLSAGVPLKRVELGTRNGSYDLLLCATPTPDRTSQLRMVDVPIYTVRDVLFVRANDPLADATLDDIRKLASDNVILTYAGTGQLDWLSAQEGLVLDVPAPNPQAVFEKLEYKRGRFVFAGEAAGANVMRMPQFAGKFRMLPTPVRTMGRYFFFSPKTPAAVVAKVEAALKELAHRGELKAIASTYVLK